VRSTVVGGPRVTRRLLVKRVGSVGSFREGVRLLLAAGNLNGSELRQALRGLLLSFPDGVR